MVRTAPTGLKPASHEQLIRLRKRAEIVPVIFTSAGDDEFKKYEIYNETAKKWGKLPRITETGTHEFDVRLKAEKNLRRWKTQKRLFPSLKLRLKACDQCWTPEMQLNAVRHQRRFPHKK